MQKIKVEEVEDYLIDLDQVINHNYEQFKAYQTEVNNFSSNSREYFQGKAGDSVRSFLNDTLTPIGGQYEKIRNDVKAAKDRLSNLIKDEFGVNGIVYDEYLNQEVTPKVNDYAKNLYEYARNINSQISEVYDIVDLDKIRIGTLEADVHSFNTSIRLTIQKLDEVENEINKDLKVINDELMELDSMLTQLVIFGTMAPSTYGDNGQKINYLSAEAFKKGKEIRIEAKELKYGEEPTLEELLKFDEPLHDAGEILKNGLGITNVAIGSLLNIGAFPLSSEAMKLYEGVEKSSLLPKDLRLTGRIFGTTFLVIGAGLTYNNAIKEGDSEGRALARTAGGTAGALAGGALGSSVLSWAGPVGIVAGGIIGSYVGSVVGESIGAAIYDAKINEKFDEAKNAANAKLDEAKNAIGDAITAPFQKVGWW